MKYIKITAVVFTLTLFLAVVGASAEATHAGFVDVTIKGLSKATLLSTHNKYKYGYQSVYFSEALDDLSSDQRAMQAKITNSSWIDLSPKKMSKFKEELTYYPADGYEHHIRAKKSTLSTVSYWGFWYWDVEMPIDN